jgi:hypothetical protein
MLRAKRGFSTKTTVAVLMSVSLLYAGAGIVVAISSTTVGFVLIGVLIASKFLFLHWLGYRELIALGDGELHPVNVLPLNGNGHRKNGSNGHHAVRGNGKVAGSKGSVHLKP